MTLKLDTNELKVGEKLIIFKATISSEGKESVLEDNIAQIQLPITYKTEIEFSGFSEPDKISFNDENQNDTQALYDIKELNNNFTIIHQIEARTRGPSPLNRLQFEVFVPNQNDGKIFLDIADFKVSYLQEYEFL